MRRFLQLLGVGLLVSVFICVGLALLWYAMVILLHIPFIERLAQTTWLGSVLSIFNASLYLLFVLSIPVGQIYSFCFVRRCHKQT